MPPSPKNKPLLSYRHPTRTWQHHQPAREALHCPTERLRARQQPCALTGADHQGTFSSASPSFKLLQHHRHKRCVSQGTPVVTGLSNWKRAPRATQVRQGARRVRVSVCAPIFLPPNDGGRAKPLRSAGYAIGTSACFIRSGIFASPPQSGPRDGGQ